MKKQHEQTGRGFGISGWMLVLLGAVVLVGFWLSRGGSDGRSGQVKTPVVTPTPNPTEVAFAQLSFDFTKSALAPEDISDLFPGTSYSLGQQLRGLGMQGLTVTYPTRIMEHVSAFAEGFATRIQVFADEGRAARAFDTEVALQLSHSPSSLELETLGDATRAFAGEATSPEGYDLGSTEYMVLVRQRNYLVMIILRLNAPVPENRLNELGKLVLRRLNP